MSLSNKTVVVTGFEPYGGRRINPAAEVAKAVDGSTIDGYAVIGAILVTPDPAPVPGRGATAR